MKGSLVNDASPDTSGAVSAPMAADGGAGAPDESWRPLQCWMLAHGNSAISAGAKPAPLFPLLRRLFDLHGDVLASAGASSHRPAGGSMRGLAAEAYGTLHSAARFSNDYRGLIPGALDRRASEGFSLGQNWQKGGLLSKSAMLEALAALGAGDCELRAAEERLATDGLTAVDFRRFYREVRSLLSRHVGSEVLLGLNSEPRPRRVPQGVMRAGLSPPGVSFRNRQDVDETVADIPRAWSGVERLPMAKKAGADTSSFGTPAAGTQVSVVDADGSNNRLAPHLPLAQAESQPATARGSRAASPPLGRHESASAIISHTCAETSTAYAGGTGEVHSLDAPAEVESGLRAPRSQSTGNMPSIHQQLELQFGMRNGV